MKFKIDKNLPAEIAGELRSLGHEADTVADEGLSGEPDPEVIAAAALEQRVLLTLDKGIANPLQYPLESHSGVVLFRPGTAGRGAVLAFIKDRLNAFLALPIKGRVTVVTRNAFRMR